MHKLTTKGKVLSKTRSHNNSVLLSSRTSTGNLSDAENKSNLHLSGEKICNNSRPPIQSLYNEWKIKVTKKTEVNAINADLSHDITVGYTDSRRAVFQQTNMTRINANDEYSQLMYKFMLDIDMENLQNAQHNSIDNERNQSRLKRIFLKILFCYSQH